MHTSINDKSTIYQISLFGYKKMKLSEYKINDLNSQNEIINIQIKIYFTICLMK